MKLLTILTSVFISIFTLNLNADSLTSQNTEYVKNFRLIANGSKISPQHSTNFRAGIATVDYRLNTVKLELNVSPKCPDGLLCTTVLKKKIIELPIVSVMAYNDCYLTVEALKDNRSEGGILEKIKFNQSLNSTCNKQMNINSDITYSTSFIELKNGEDVTAVSILKADLIRPSIEINQ